MTTLPPSANGVQAGMYRGGAHRGVIGIDLRSPDDVWWGEHLPIHGESHVRTAIARFNQTDFESKTARDRARRMILRAAKRFGIEVDEDANVRKGSWSDSLGTSTPL